MQANFPYHFCATPECHEMIPPGIEFCPAHAPSLLIDDDFADASQLPRNTQPSVTGDADPNQESTS